MKYMDHSNAIQQGRSILSTPNNPRTSNGPYLTRLLEFFEEFQRIQALLVFSIIHHPWIEFLEINVESSLP
jgi:hypothetical protein